jgi:iron complex transport system substrate-binding protein
MKFLLRKKRGVYFLFGVKIKIFPKKIGIVFLMSVLLLSIMTACDTAPSTTISPPATLTGQPENTNTFPLTITDQTGRMITLKSTPQRIISLAPSNTEILFALGLADRIVGVTDYCNYPPEAKQKPSIGGFSTPNIEEVVAKNPDIVIAASRHAKEIVPKLESRGITVLILEPTTIAMVPEAITMAGQAMGKQAEAGTITNNMQQRIKAMTDKTSLSSLRPSVCFIVWHDPLNVAGSGTFHDELIDKAGGVNIAHKLTGYSKDFSLENLIAANVEVIIAGVGMGDGEDKPLQFIQAESRLKDTPARINNRVYPINQDIVGRAGPRIVDALDEFTQFIHPELFK